MRVWKTIESVKKVSTGHTKGKKRERPYLRRTLLTTAKRELTVVQEG